MEVTQPKLAIGLRGRILPEGESTLRQELALMLFFAMILGWTSRCYQEILLKMVRLMTHLILRFKFIKNFQFLIISLVYVSADCYGNKFATIFKQSSNV